jgi:hypothetical protein
MAAAGVFVGWFQDDRQVRGEDGRRSGEMFPATVLVFECSHDPSAARPALAFASGGKNRPLRSG